LNLLEIVEAMGLNPYKTGVTHGGEFHSPCPRCGGKDRFMIWPNRGKEGMGAYYCRRCEVSGDAIQFLREFQNLTYKEACLALNHPIQERFGGIRKRVWDCSYKPTEVKIPSKEWMLQAGLFVRSCHKELYRCSTHEGKSMLTSRGLKEEGIEKWLLGWNGEEKWISKNEWGIPDDFDQKIWIPKGVVIPSFSENIHEPIKIKIRRSDWYLGDKLPKYVELAGSAQRPALYGDAALRKIILVESELDAILLHGEAGDLVRCFALGGCTKKPDLFTHKLLKNAERVLIALDTDEAGRKAYGWWKKNYANAKSWPVPICKSPGDAYQSGINLREWILQGIQKST